MRKIIILLKLIFALGVVNVVYMFWYRVTLRSGLRKKWFPGGSLPSGIFFNDIPFSEKNDSYPGDFNLIMQNANDLLYGKLVYFSRHKMICGNPPEWHKNVFNQKVYSGVDKHWTELPDFQKGFGDIKTIWEPSRFMWLTSLTAAYRLSGERRYIDTINQWLNDWIKNNPYNTGPNWKCGQEASFRLFNLLNSSFVLQQAIQPTSVLAEFIYFHLIRINGNINYAIAQDNNHGTSEAAALLAGGAWLYRVNKKKYPDALDFADKGYRLLEARVKKLISSDGSFSQHSTNYHRVMLDTLCMAEFWRLQTEFKPFSAGFYGKIKSAVFWLQSMLDPVSGRVPNLGANDGAYLLQFHTLDYTDFRPTLQFASAIFFKKKFFSEVAYNEPLYWFDLNNNQNETFKIKKNQVLQSGYVLMGNEENWAMIRLPVFPFRPSHNDVFHFDLWYKGANIICDSGTYSYNPPEEETYYDFKSVKAHNTVSFDNMEQMPQISRFLMAEWLKSSHTGDVINSGNNVQWTGSYKDNFSNIHTREIMCSANKWIIKDTLEGKFKSAQIGFNFSGHQAKIISDSVCVFQQGKISFQGAGKLADAFVSKYYYERESIRRLIIEVKKPGVYETVIELN